METNPINLTITHRGSTYPISAHSDDILESLHAQLEELTGVAHENQKLLFKGKKTAKKDVGDAVTLAEMGLKDGMKVQMLGSTAQGMRHPAHAFSRH